jgi:hypothetical protein
MSMCRPHRAPTRNNFAADCLFLQTRELSFRSLLFLIYAVFCKAPGTKLKGSYLPPAAAAQPTFAAIVTNAFQVRLLSQSLERRAPPSSGRVRLDWVSVIPRMDSNSVIHRMDSNLVMLPICIPTRPLPVTKP